MLRPAEQIVGRTAELDSLNEALADLARRRPGALEVVGEPGIGKTRLLAELGANADARGMIVLAGSASELERELPFWVFIDALDDYLRGLDPRRLGGLGADARSELAHVFPSIEANGGDGGTVERYRTHRAVCELLGAVAAVKPLVLLLDDLHWADTGSLELLGALLRRPPSAPVLMALALRPRQIPERLEPSLERALRAQTLVRLDVGPLDRDEAARLVGDVADAPALYEQSGGNPLYLQQLVRAPRRAHGPATAEVSLAGVQVPRAVALGLAEEIAALSAGARALLDGAAVAGDPFELDLAAAAGQLSEAPTIDALDELAGCDLVRATDVPRRFRFRHPLVRATIYDGTRAGWRLGAHERCAGVLAGRGASAAVRAHHVEQAARPGDLAAVAVLREAAEAAARDPGTATRLYTAALRLLGAAPGRVALLSARARAQASAGQFLEARAGLLECLELVHEDEIATRAQLTGMCAGLEHLLGYHESAGRRLNAAFETLGDTTTPEAVALMIEIAVDGLYREEHAYTRDWARRALAAARSLGDGPLTASAAGVLAHGCALLGAIDEAEHALAEAAALVDALPEHELARCLDYAVNMVTATASNLGRFAQADVYADRALSVASATGQGNILSIHWWAGVVRIYRGRLPEAVGVLDTAIEVARLTDYREGLARMLTVRAMAATAAGELEDALTFAEESIALLRGTEVSWPWMLANWTLAGVLLDQGEAERAADLLLEVYGGEEAPLAPLRGRPELFELLAGSQAACGRHEDAARTVRRARRCADDLRLPFFAATAGRTAAVVALEAGDPTAAAELALRAAEVDEHIGAVIHAARARLLAGRALAAAGDAERAASELERAAAAYERSGAIRRRDEAERELRKLGHRRVHRRTQPGTPDGDAVASLTGRELQVASLIVDRRTNAEIAATLFVSQKTVETHVRNLFHKLGVSSRVEVARVVERSSSAP